MDRRVYRICRARYARLDGDGARHVGGRWNSPGRAVVYMAENCPSAVLEVASAIVPHEHNYLLNPSHPDFLRIVAEPPAIFHFDSRLFG